METYRNQVRVAAHRGNSAFFPENTMAAYRSALELPVDQVEVDLHMTRDGRIVMMHDAKVDRTTDGTGRISSMSAAEVRALDAGKWKGAQFAGERVPLFEEFLELMQDHPQVTMNVELKDYPEQGAEEWAWRSADTALAMIERYGMRERVWINSFSAPLLEYVDSRCGHGYRLHGYYPFSALRGTVGRDPFDYLHCACLWGTAEEPVRAKAEFDYVRSRGVEPWVFARMDKPQLYAQFVQNGAMLITTNDPRTCIDYLHAQGLHEA